MKTAHSRLYCALCLLALASCAPINADKTVTIEVSNIENGKESDAVLEILKTMYDNDAGYKLTKSQFSGKQLTVEMAPVTDVDAFWRRIDFGTVTQVSGRTVKVVYLRSGATIGI